MRLKIPKSMKTGSRILCWVGFPMIFFAGIIVGKTIQNFPLIEWDKKVDFISALSLLVTIAVSIMIPFLIKKLIDDKRDIKTFLVEEMKDLIKIVSSIRDVISDSYLSTEFKASDRDKIIYTFHSAQLKLQSITSQLEISFKKDSKDIILSLKESLSEYNRYLTDSQMMLSTFTKVDDHFYKENNNEYSKIETALKMTIHKIHKF